LAYEQLITDRNYGGQWRFQKSKFLQI
jgi:hypothetical protein